MPKSPHGYDTKSWNPTTGCTKVSAGCKNCWAEEYSRRMGWPWKVTLHPERLDEPLKWRKPQVVACCYMGDLFHEDVPDEFIDRVFAVMALTPHHTYLLLTKRPERMRTYLAAGQFRDVAVAAYMNPHPGPVLWPWPLPNVYLGVSIEDQATADKRIPLLLETPAAHRWVSAEPLLGPLYLLAYTPAFRSINLLPGIDWLVVGGESGPRHRSCDPAWIADIVAQCDAAGVPCYVKQASHRYPGRQGDIADALWARKAVPW